MEILLIYLLLINALALYCVRSDKKRARFSRYLVGERTFLILSVLGGSIGVLLGMHYYKYLKERAAFRIGIPVILVGQVLLTLLFIMG